MLLPHKSVVFSRMANSLVPIQNRTFGAHFMLYPIESERVDRGDSDTCVRVLW